MTIKELKELIEDLHDDMVVLLTSDEEWNSVRLCDSYNNTDYVWDKHSDDIYEIEELEDDVLNELERCFILC